MLPVYHNLFFFLPYFCTSCKKKTVLLTVHVFCFCFFFCPQRSPVFVGQSSLMNFTIYVSGEDCNVPEKRVSLELEDKSVFSVVVGIKNDEIVFGKVT